MYFKELDKKLFEVNNFISKSFSIVVAVSNNQLLILKDEEYKIRYTRLNIAKFKSIVNILCYFAKSASKS